MRPDEKRAEALLKARGLQPEPYPEARTKTPDFKVTGPRDVFFLAEVKSILTGKPDAPLLFDTLYNNIGKDIRKAAKQFIAVNYTRSVPNVLIWVPHDFRITVDRFVALIQGAIIVEKQVIRDLKKFRDGSTRPSLEIIDLHICLGANDVPSFVFLNHEPRFTRQLRRAFGQ